MQIPDTFLSDEALIGFSRYMFPVHSKDEMAHYIASQILAITSMGYRTAVYIEGVGDAFETDEADFAESPSAIEYWIDDECVSTNKVFS